MIYVVDASAAVGWFVQEEGGIDTAFLLDSSIVRIVPDLVFSEVANVLQRKLRLGHLTLGQAKDALSSLDHVFDKVICSTVLFKQAFELSRKLDHSVYDCMYLATALSTNDSFLVTSDKKFLIKAHAAGEGGRIHTVETAQALFLSAQENKHG